MSAITPDSSKANSEMHFWQKAETMRPIAALVLAIGAALAVGAAVTAALPFLPFAATAIAVDTTTLLSITIPLIEGGVLISACALYPMCKSYPQKNVQSQTNPTPPPKTNPAPAPQPNPIPPHNATNALAETLATAAKTPLPDSSDSDLEEPPAPEHEDELQPENYEMLDALKKFVGQPELKFSTAQTAPSKNKQCTGHKDSFVSRIHTFVKGLTAGKLKVRKPMSQEEETFRGELTHPAQFCAILDFAQAQLEAFNAQLSAEMEKDNTLKVELIDIVAFMEQLEPYRRAASWWSQLLQMAAPKLTLLEQKHLDALSEMKEKVPKSLRPHLTQVVECIAQKPAANCLDTKTTLDALGTALNQQFNPILNFDNFVAAFGEYLRKNVNDMIQHFLNKEISLAGAIVAIEAIQRGHKKIHDQFFEAYGKTLDVYTQLSADLNSVAFLLNHLSLIHGEGVTIDNKIATIEEFASMLPTAEDAFWTSYPQVLACLREHFSTLFVEGYFANYRFCNGALIANDGIDHRGDSELKEKLKGAVQNISTRLSIDPPDISEESDTNDDGDAAMILFTQELAGKCKDWLDDDQTPAFVANQIGTSLDQLKDDAAPISAETRRAYLLQLLIELNNSNPATAGKIRTALIEKGGNLG